MGQLLSFFRNLTQRCHCSSEQRERESITLETVSDSKVPGLALTDISRIAGSTTDPCNSDTAGDLKLTDHQVEDLAEVIVSKHMATIAIKYLGLPQETVENLRSMRQNDFVGFNRDVLSLWRNKNPGINHTQVRLFLHLSLNVLS